jgi:hypothetical protein
MMGTKWIFTLDNGDSCTDIFPPHAINKKTNKSEYSLSCHVAPLMVKDGVAYGMLFNYNQSKMSVSSLKKKMAEIKKGYGEKDLRRYMTYDETELNIADNAPVGDEEFKQLAGKEFRNLRIININNRNITDSGLKYFYELPVEELVLSQQKITSDGLDELLMHLPKIKSLNLANSKLSDAGLKNLDGKFLEKLVIYNTNVTDTGLSYFKKFRNLKLLNISGRNLGDSNSDIRLTNKGYIHLATLTNLEDLSISEQNINNQTLVYLKDLPLKSLSIYDSSISDDGLNNIAAIHSLKKLRIVKCNIGDKGVNKLSNLKELEEIDLTYTQISDESLKYLDQLKSLKTIHLFSTNISDLGLSYLKNVPNLNYINLQHTNVTKSGVDNFKSAFPQISIVDNLH